MLRILPTAMTCLLVATSLLFRASSADPDPSRATRADPSRATLAFNSFVGKFWNGSYLLQTFPGKQSSDYWIAMEGFNAIVDYAALQQAQTGRVPANVSALIKTLVATQDRMGWSRDWYDDEAWAANSLISAFELLGTPSLLTRAQQLFADIQAAWDTTTCTGGLWWDRKRTQKATASNAGAVIVAVRLSRHVQDPSLVPFAAKVFEFWRSSMVNPASGQVCDHNVPQGCSQTWWSFTYNQGLMVGAALGLYNATGDAQYLSDAELFASFTLSQQVQQVPGVGTVLFSDCGAGVGAGNGAVRSSQPQCVGDCAQFKGPTFRFLSQLAAAQLGDLQQQQTQQQRRVDGDRVRLQLLCSVADVLTASAEAVWSVARDPASTLFGCDWAESYSSVSTSQAQQNTAVTVLALHEMMEASGLLRHVRSLCANDRL